MYIYKPYVFRAPKTKSDPLKLELQMAMSHCVGGESATWLLWKSNWCSSLSSRPSLACPLCVEEDGGSGRPRNLLMFQPSLKLWAPGILLSLGQAFLSLSFVLCCFTDLTSQKSQPIRATALNQTVPRKEKDGRALGNLCVGGTHSLGGNT